MSLLVFEQPFGELGLLNTSRFTPVLAQLLPPSENMWKLEVGSVLRSLLNAVGDTCESITARGVDLINESDPRTADETISDWERIVGLPDDQVPVIPADLASRRVAVVSKLVSQGGQNQAFFMALCLACGYPLLSISVHPMLRVGFRVGDRCYGVTYTYTMTLTLGPPLAGALARADFERVIRHATHAGIVDIFVYT